MPEHNWWTPNRLKRVLNNWRLLTMALRDGYDTALVASGDAGLDDLGMHFIGKLGRPDREPPAGIRAHSSPTSPADFDLCLIHADISRVLLSLPAKWRLTVLAHRAWGYSLGEIARRTGRGYRTVKRWNESGFTCLRKQLGI